MTIWILVAIMAGSTPAPVAPVLTSEKECLAVKADVQKQIDQEKAQVELSCVSVNLKK